MNILCMVVRQRCNFFLYWLRCSSHESQTYDVAKVFRKVKRFKQYTQHKIASRICLTVVGNGSIGQPRSVCLFTDYKSYMFNCGEGTTRLIKEHEVNLTDIRHVFITQKTWGNIGGLADLYNHNQNYGLMKMTVHGPPGIEQFQDVLTSFKKLRLSIKGVADSPYSDENIVIETVPISYDVISRKFGSISQQDKEISNEGLVAFICKVNARREVLPEKCIEHGVPIGPLLTDLNNGKDVVLPSGKIVHSEDVCFYQPEYTFLIVDCPSEKAIDAFVHEQKFNQYYASENSEALFCDVFHFSPLHIVRSYKYQAWMNRFHPKIRHFMLNSSNSTMHLEVVHQMQHILHELHPQIFPLLHEKSVIDVLDIIEDKTNIIQADARLQFYLRPHILLDRANIVSEVPDSYIEKLQTVPGFMDNLQELRKVISEREHGLDKDADSEQYPEVVFLGTSSSTSSAFRNVSGILVNISPEHSILLDCGEGTYSQLLRHYGQNCIFNVLKRISCIFISHHHSDHYLGLFTLVKARKEAFYSCSEYYQPVAIVTSNIVNSIISNFHDLFEPIRADIRVFLCHLLASRETLHQRLRYYMKNINISTVEVKHCAESYGIVIYGDKWKLVYSGDAAPSQSLIDAGRDCTILIHEASIEDDFCNEAAVKRHSTPSQVVEIAREMNAKYTILTHFSKRYLAIPILPELEGQHIGYSFDHMVVKLKDMPILPLLVPSLKFLFSGLLESHEERTSITVNFEKAFLRALKS